nr:unnamed protein product [Leishmania braziliensis]
MATIGMFNEEGENVDLYIPRKCHATNTLIEAHDHAAVQISIANVGSNGVIDGTTTTLCIAGYLRSQGESDHAINHIAIDRRIVRIKTGKPKRASKSKSKKPAARGAAAGGAAAAQKGGSPACAEGSPPVCTEGGSPACAEGSCPDPQEPCLEEEGTRCRGKG